MRNAKEPSAKISFGCGFAALCKSVLHREKIRRLTRMAGYVIANVVWKDSESLAVYKRLMPSSVEKYGGRFLVRGGAVEVLEGEWSPALVVIEFPTVEQARQWYSSEEYRPALEIRQRAADNELLIVEGTAPPAL
jgi:uncharacterized protein (DUF1330 family)